MTNLNKKTAFQLRVANKFRQLHKSAKTRNIPFTLTITGVANLLRAKRCYYTGLPLTKDNFSVDRIDNTKGYETGNVAACDVGFNKKKGELTPQEIATLYKKISKL